MYVLAGGAPLAREKTDVHTPASLQKLSLPAITPDQDSIATGVAKEFPLVRKAGRSCCTCELGPLHCQVAALHKLQPVLNRELSHCPDGVSYGLLTWQLTQPAADICQRLAAPLTACCEGALQGPQLPVPA